jgi:hypothetical protein
MELRFAAFESCLLVSFEFCSSSSFRAGPSPFASQAARIGAVSGSIKPSTYDIGVAFAKVRRAIVFLIEMIMELLEIQGLADVSLQRVW